MSDKKIYVLDTNVLIHDPHSLECFEEHDICIPAWVVDELDGIKTEAFSRRGRAARIVSPLVEKMHKEGRLRVEFQYAEIEAAKHMVKNNDLYIILCAHHIQKENPNTPVVLVSKDAIFRVKARVCGLAVEDYKNDKIISSIEDIYARVRDIFFTREDILSHLYRDKKIEQQRWAELNSYDMLPNECCRLVREDNPHMYALAMFKDGFFHLIEKPSKMVDKYQKTKSILPLNDEQALARALLIDPSILVVALAGDAGTGKTILSLDAGIDLLDKQIYGQILVFRPVIEIGRSLGYMKGTLKEKFAPWEQPILDNLKLIFKCRRKDLQESKEGNAGVQAMKHFIETEKIDIIPILHQLGRTVRDSLVIIDDAQNLTPEETEMLLSRAGGNTKMVLTGDISQIHDRHLDAMSNGISHTIDSFRGDKNFGHITLLEVERSVIADMVARLMKKPKIKASL